MKKKMKMKMKNMMKYYDCVSQYAVNLILEPFTKRAHSVKDKSRYYT